MRFFSANEVYQALDFSKLADAIAAMFRAAPTAPLRHAHALSEHDALLLMPAWSDGDGGALGVKLVTVLPENRTRGVPTVHAVYVLFERATGAPRALIDGESLTLMRTAAASLLAARYLARPDASNVLVIGTGHLAPFLARAHCRERVAARLTVWGRNADAAHAVVQRLRETGLAAVAAADLEAAVRAADIVSCATTSTAPIVRGEWLKPGCHVDLVGGFRRVMREADDAAVRRARLFVDTFAGALAEAGDIIDPLERGVIARSDVLGELIDLVNGRVQGRTSPDEITLFKSLGTAIEDLAAARLLAG
jgi:ornithine cyclodeaminase/alanine dehydrogenase-like protein (mu-crystallin family)